MLSHDAEQKAEDRKRALNAGTDPEFQRTLRAAIRWRNRTPDCRVTAGFFAYERDVKPAAMKELVTALGRFAETEIVEMRARGMSIRQIRNARRPVADEQTLFHVQPLEPNDDVAADPDSDLPLDELLTMFRAAGDLEMYAMREVLHAVDPVLWRARATACQVQQERLWLQIYSRIQDALADVKVEVIPNG